MPTLQEVEAWRGRKAVDPDGDKIGSIEDVYLDRQSGEPEWLAIKTGLFGRKVSFVPVRGAQAGDENEVRLAHAKDRVKDAPKVDPDGELSPEEERRLYQHYERTDYDEWSEHSEDRTATGGDVDVDDDSNDDRETGYATAGTDVREDRTTARGGDVEEGHTDTVADRERSRAAIGDDRGDGPRGDVGDVGDGGDGGTDDAMTRSDEELHVGTERRETGRARLRKHVTTEQETRTVPLEREEARIEREPISDANVEHAMSGPELSEAEHEVTLHAEEPVVEKRVEPKERLRLDTDVHTEEHTVSDEVRKEHVEPEGDVER